MNIPAQFSVSDLLERIIPGALALAPPFLFWTDLPDGLVDGTSGVLLVFFAIAASYAFGVVLNTLSTRIFIKGYRSYWPKEDYPPRIRAIADAIRQHYGVTADCHSWKLCYGTCVRNGYSVNVELFLGLEVFCRSMAAGCLVVAATAISDLTVRVVCAVLPISATTLPASIFMRDSVTVGLALALFLAFRKGAGNYSRAFVGAIYEGFFSYVKDRNAAPVGRESI